MTRHTTRRDAISGIAFGALAVWLGLPSAAAAAQVLKFHAPEPFSFDDLTERARKLAREPFQRESSGADEMLGRIDFEQHIEIGFREDATLFADTHYPVRLFHPGKFFKVPVHISVIEGDASREIVYSHDLFTYGPKAKFAEALPDDIGFAGFRVMNPSLRGDWLAYLGAAYFRTAGDLHQYGLSARGIAVDTGLEKGEEFPDFTHFYLEPTADKFIVYALMNGPSITGAYRFEWVSDPHMVGGIEARLFARADIDRLGIAPLTSMYWYSETHRGPDWRPEVHDSDGLSMWTGWGERIWRPLNNPPRVMTSTFTDNNPKGFGLLQRDRRFEDYEDDGVFYHKRPSVWVEPIGDWGKGAVQLLEIPTDMEIHDNIVAYWVPEKLVRQGDAMTFAYRMYWTAEEPFPPQTARVINTYSGRGGRPGDPPAPGFTKYVIDLEGGGIDQFKTTDGLIANVEASRGELQNVAALRVDETNKWRMWFDIKADGVDPVDIRAYLKAPDGRALSETWLYQHFPQPGS
ncbi:MAG: glucan biosynthesis protein [Hyphomicrobiales bacterium]